MEWGGGGGGNIQNNPGHANPVTNLAAATERQHWVLSRMVLTGAITEAEHAQPDPDAVMSILR